MSPPAPSVHREFVLIVLAALAMPARAEIINIPHGCHAQQTNFYCGPGAMQMLLDTPAVRNANPNVVALLDNPPPPNPGMCLNIIPFPNPMTQDQWVQYQLYCASRPRNFPFPMLGTWPAGASLTVNAYDGIQNGPPLPYGIPQGGNPNHSYAWYGLINYSIAMKTIAQAMKLTDVPAMVLVNGGQHWVVIDGVQTNANVVQNGNYKVTYVHVSDPWTGACGDNAPAPPANGQVAHLGGWYRIYANVNGTQPLWYKVFDPVTKMPPPYYGQYIIMVEPPQPIPPDDGTFNGIPEPAPLLPEPLTAETALTHVQPFLDDPNEFAHDLFDDGGSFNTDIATFRSLPGAPPGQGDWVIPFEGPAAGSDDILGAIAVDALTGMINEASRWDDSDPETLQDFNDHYGDLYALDFPADECYLPGDVNRDADRNGKDIPAFINCVMNGCSASESVCADLDGSGTVDTADVAPFAAALIGG